MNLKVATNENSLTIIGFDGSQGVELTIKAEIIESGSGLLPVKLLCDLINKLTGGELTFALNSNSDSVQIISGKSSYKLPCRSIEDYPELPTPDQDPVTPVPKSLKKSKQSAKQPVNSKNNALIPVQAIKHGLKTILLSASADIDRPLLTGVYLKVENENKLLILASTDGHRLAEAKHYIEGDAELQDVEMVIPALALKEADQLFSIFKSDASTIGVHADDQVIEFTWATEAGQQRFVSRSLQRNYPGYLALIPKLFGKSVTIELKDFISALERIAVLAEKTNNIVRISVTFNQLRIFADVADVGSGSEELQALTIGDPADTAFNVKYLLEGIRTFSEQNILMQMNGPIEQVVFSPIGNNNLIYLVMPVQIRD